jgi:hypothetical protein
MTFVRNLLYKLEEAERGKAKEATRSQQQSEADAAEARRQENQERRRRERSYAALRRLIIAECEASTFGRKPKRQSLKSTNRAEYDRLREEFIARNKAEIAERLARYEARRLTR